MNLLEDPYKQVGSGLFYEKKPGFWHKVMYRAEDYSLAIKYDFEKFFVKEKKWWKWPFLALFFLFRMFSHLLVSIIDWFRVSEPRWRTVTAIILLISTFAGILFYGNQATYAASFVFNQTDWSGGANVATIGHPTNQTGWTKYVSSNADTGTAGSIKSSSYSLGPTANITASTTYKDNSATTANWDGGGSITPLVGDSWCNISSSACNTSWLNRKKISFDNSASGTDLTNFPVLVVLNSSNIDYSKTKAGGADLRFVDAGGTSALSYQIELWNASGTSYVWVKVPQLDHTNTDYMYMYYNNTSASDNQSATAVWDSNYKAVWHFPNGSALSAADSTSNANNGTINGPTASSGQVDGAANFVRTSNQNITKSANSSLNITNGTISFWTKPTGISAGIGYPVINYPRCCANNITHAWFVALTGVGSTIVVRVNLQETAYDKVIAITQGSWQHITVSFDGSNVTWYKNGVSQGTVTQTTTPSADNSGNLEIGGNVSGSGFHNGDLDELRVSNSVRSADWVKAEYTTENNAMNTFGSEESNFGNIAQSIAVDSTTDNIKTATITATVSGSVTWELSNDGGSSWTSATSGSPLTFSSAGSDLRVRATLTSGASISSLTLSYTGYYSSSELTSSAFDSSDSGNLVSKLAWTATGTTGTEMVKLQVQTSADGISWSGWCGASDSGSSCDGSDFFTSSDNDVNISSNNPLRSGGNDRWFQYKVTMISGGLATASLNDLNITYVVNAPPEFNSINGLMASQITDSNDPNYGKVQIDYSIRDPDTSTGTNTPGFITPSFEYNIGGGWITINSQYLVAGDLSDKAVESVNYTDYTAYWDAKSQIPTNYAPIAQIRMTLNDNEAANNTTTSTTNNFVLDTKNPILSSFAIDGINGVVIIIALDDLNLEYRLSNNADQSDDGLNSTSGEWQSAGGNSISVSPSWEFATTPVHPTVYLEIRDEGGNTTSQTAVGPNTPADLFIKDVSDPSALSFHEFLSWDVYTSVSGATFQEYDVYRAVGNNSFTQVATITNINTNYYADLNLTQNETYSYKVLTIDSDDDTSDFSEELSDAADGQGGSDTAAPNISNINVSGIETTAATITWDTDELSDSEVDFSVSPSTTFSDGTATISSFTTSHSVTLTGLTPGETYLFRVKSTDPVANTATDDNSGAGYNFTTSSGPEISDVTETSVNAHTATIFWNTDIDSNSFVTYSDNSDLSNSTQTGSSSLVGGSGPEYQHTVTLTGLDSGVTYYYFVESTDGSSNYSRDTNGNNYYSFRTTNDNQGPTISGVDVPVRATTAAAIVWQTDEPATTQAHYGTVSGTYTDTTTKDNELTTFHVVALSGLTENTTYFFQVISEDDGDNEAISSESSFITDEIQIVRVGGGGGSSGQDLDTTEPRITGIKVNNISAFKANITYTTDEDTIGIIKYGSDPDKLTRSAGDENYAQSHSIDLAGLVMGTNYTFTITATDGSGNQATSESEEFTTQFFTESTINITDAAAFQSEVDEAIESALPSLVPPFIEKPQVTDVTDTSATVKWRTNTKAYSAVSFAPEDQYDKNRDNPYVTEIADTTNRVQDHVLNLVNLKPNTRYHLVAKSFSLPQLQGKSPDLTFVTQAPKIQALISLVTNNSFKVNWRSIDATSSVVEYKNLTTGIVNQKSNTEKSVEHEVIIDQLSPGTTYEVNVFGYNDKDNKVSTANSLKVTTSKDTTAPVITSLKIDSALIPGRNDKTQTIVSWKTDEPSTSSVFFQEGTGSAVDKDKPLANKVELTNDLSQDHAVVLTILKPGSLYRIQIQSVDSAGNLVLLPTRTIIIPRQTQSVLDIIFKNFEDAFKFLR